MPPFSEIEESATFNATVGAASSSAMVSVAAVGSVTPLPPDTVADTVTDLSGSSFALSFAVTVTTPVLAVSPAAMVSVAWLDSVKSPAPAFVPAVAATVSVTASLDARSSVAVTVLALPAPLSAIVSGFEGSGSDNASVATGVASSSFSVSDAPFTVRVCESAVAWALAAVPVTVTERSPTLSMASSTAVIVAVSDAFAVSPAAITMVAPAPTV